MAAQEYDIVIIGGGIVGTTLACAVANSGMRIALIDNVKSRPKIIDDRDYDLRVSAITLASQSVFEAIGAWKSMTQRRISCVEAMEIWDEGGSGRISFNSDEVAQPCLSYIIENRVMLSALRDNIGTAHNIDYLSPANVVGLSTDDQQTRVLLENGDELLARVAVGADGADSLVRKLSDIETDGQSFKQKAIVATVRTASEHARVARQRFLKTGPLAFLPLFDVHLCSIVWSADNDRADEIMALDEAAFNAELQQAFGDSLGSMELMSERAMFPLVSAHAQQYLAERIVLVGDAAHRIHPLAGQGLNLGLGDIAVLAEVLVEAHQAGKDIGAHKVLRRYERWRKGGNAFMLMTMDIFKRVFGSENDIVQHMRNFGLEFADSVPALKHQFMRIAAGQSGNLPKLMRGVQL